MVAEGGGVEAVEAAGGRLGLGVHEEGQGIRVVLCSGEVDVLGVVEGDPVHLPGAEEAVTGGLDFGALHGEVAGRLFEDDLADVGGVDGNPAEAGEPDLGAAVLGLADVGGGGAEGGVAEARGRDADAVDIAGGEAGGAGKADEEGADVGALAAEVAGFEQGRMLPVPQRRTVGLR